MNTNQIKEAENLFQKTYGKTCYEAGFNTIDTYKKQHAFLYGKDDKAIKNYKISQNIIRFILRWYFWPLIILVYAFLWNITNHFLVVFFMVTIMIYAIIGLALCFVGWRYYKKQEGKVTYLNC